MRGCERGPGSRARGLVGSADKGLERLLGYALPSEQVLWNGHGYQPVVLYFVEADQVLGDEFRDGNVPAGMENLRLIQHGFASLPSTIKGAVLSRRQRLL